VKRMRWRRIKKRRKKRRQVESKCKKIIDNLSV
jgi:hypothetical protein